MFEPLDTGDPETEWMFWALCRGMPWREANDIFFALPSKSPAKAKAICLKCPVREHCLDWALKYNQRHGVWGGMTDGERQQILDGKRSRGLKICAVCGEEFIPGKNGAQQKFCGITCRKRHEKRLRNNYYQ